MPNETQLRRGPVADVAPTLDELTQNVLFGDVWERSGLSKRDRSLITVATLVAMYRTNELPLHMTRAREWRHERGARRADHASHVLRWLAPQRAPPSASLDRSSRTPRSRYPIAEMLNTETLIMDIKRAGSSPSTKGNADWFSGTVRVDPLFQAAAPARVAGAKVTFEPGARTAWHTHPLGQTLIVTEGFGLAQREGGPIEEIRPGDVVWFPPNEKHWHGASPTTALTHIAVQEALDGKAVDWMEKVTDDQYRKYSGGASAR